MNIDWSKAPEGATHYDKNAGVFCNQNGFWNIYKQWIASANQHEWGTSRFIAKDTLWSGAGLPPVGVIVKLRTKRTPEDAFEGWGKAEIMYSSKGAVVWRWQGHSLEFGAEWDDVEFEAIRTPEQIAAEEREKAVSEMAVIALSGDNDLINTAWLERLYDAGYRKQVKP